MSWMSDPTILNLLMTLVLTLLGGASAAKVRKEGGLTAWVDNVVRNTSSMQEIRSKVTEIQRNQELIIKLLTQPNGFTKTRPIQSISEPVSTDTKQ
jgi:hypothetical protein